MAALVALGACQPLPHPFADDRPPPGSPLMRVRDSAGIAVAPVSGVPAPLSADIAEAVAAALRDNDVPASTRARNRDSYALAGTATARPMPGARLALDLEWRLRGPDGADIAKEAQRAEVPARAWQAGDKQLLAGLAKAAAPRLAALFQDKGSVAVDDGSSVLVVPVKGAPGDGSSSLARAMAAVLRRAHVALVDDKAAAGRKHFTVAGTVSVAPPLSGKQQVKVSWALIAPDGRRVGEVNQENAVRAGSLDHYWGDIAYAVSEAAAGGIVALLDHIKALGIGS